MSTIWAPIFTGRDLEISSVIDVYSGFCSVKRYSFRFKLFEGSFSAMVQRELVYRTPVVNVLLYDPEKRAVVLIEQVRVGALEDSESPWLLEIVGGMVDEGESVEDSAYREAMEETGHTIVKLIPITQYWVTPGISNERTTVFCGLVRSRPSGAIQGLEAEGEDIKVHVIPVQDAFFLVRAGKVTTSPAIIALQWLELNGSSELLNF